MAHNAENDAGRKDFGQAVSDEAQRARKFWRDALNRYAAQARERHRANGCRLFDDKFARCTCPIPPADGGTDE